MIDTLTTDAECRELLCLPEKFRRGSGEGHEDFDAVFARFDDDHSQAMTFAEFQEEFEAMQNQFDELNFKLELNDPEPEETTPVRQAVSALERARQILDPTVIDTLTVSDSTVEPSVVTDGKKKRKKKKR